MNTSLAVFVSISLSSFILENKIVFIIFQAILVSLNFASSDYYNNYYDNVADFLYKRSDPFPGDFDPCNGYVT